MLKISPPGLVNMVKVKLIPAVAFLIITSVFLSAMAMN